MRYHELVLRIGSVKRGGYRIVAESDLLQAPVEQPFTPPWTVEEFRELEIAVTRDVRRQLEGSDDRCEGGSADEGKEVTAGAGERKRALSPRAAGTALSTTALTGKVGCALERALEEAAGDDAGLRIRLVFRADEPPEQLELLTGLPWELLWLRSRQRYLGRSRRTPIVRDLEYGGRVAALRTQRPLVVLVADSGATDLPLQNEARRLRGALGDRRLFDPYYLERPEIFELRQELQVRRAHILHFMGHGSYNDKSGRGGIFFVSSRGEEMTILGEVLAESLADLPHLRLVVLNTCQSGMMRGPEGLAAALLMRDSPPAVVAMRQPITNGAAERFSAVFYGQLAAGDPVDVALSEARLALSSRGSEWATPVLYMPSRDGRLFDLGDVEPEPLRRSVPFEERDQVPVHVAIHSRGEFGALKRYEAGFRKELGDCFNPPDSPYLADDKSWHGDVFEPLSGFLLDSAKDERPLLLDTAMHQSVAFAAGWVLHTKSGIDVIFRQRSQGGGDYTDWDLGDFSEEEETFWVVDEGTVLDSESDDVALAVSVSRKTDPDVRKYLETSGLGVRRLLHASLAKPGGRAVAGGAHCLQLAWDLDTILRERSSEEREGTLHVFGAAPNAFWFAVGQLSHGFGPVQLYEYDFDADNQFGKYVPSFRFPIRT